MENTAYFADTNQAISWFMEQRRNVSKIKTTKFDYKNEEPDTALSFNQVLKWAGVIKYPETREEIAMVNAQMVKSFNKLDKRTKVILLLLNLGDFATPELYEKAKKSQKILRAQGYRVVLQYKYSQSKVAKLLNIDRTTVYRNLKKANALFEEELKKQGFVLDHNA